MTPIPRTIPLGYLFSLLPDLVQPEAVEDLRQLRQATPGLTSGEIIAAVRARDWLTPFQADRLLQGRGASLFVANGRYVLQDLLGRGGQAAVYKARDRPLNRT